jgi:hypothetical protein
MPKDRNQTRDFLYRESILAINLRNRARSHLQDCRPGEPEDKDTNYALNFGSDIETS